jgi:hypothetical protein
MGASSDGPLYIPDLETLEFASIFNGITEVIAAYILPHQRRNITGPVDEFAMMWSIADDDRVYLNGHRALVTEICALDCG